MIGSISATKMQCDIAFEGSIPLSLTPTKITGWTEIVPSRNITVETGSITFLKTGEPFLSLERVYQNTDQNPTEVINATIDVRRNGVTLFTRTLPLASATNPNEPSIAAFTSNGIREITKGDVFEIYASAVDNGVSAQGVTMINARMVVRL